MKHIITLAVALALATVTLPAKEIVKNEITGMTLSENLGIYTISGKGGAIILGNKDHAKEFSYEKHIATYIKLYKELLSLPNEEEGK